MYQPNYLHSEKLLQAIEAEMNPDYIPPRKSVPRETQATLEKEYWPDHPDTPNL